jgi:hypothetical protein
MGLLYGALSAAYGKAVGNLARCMVAGLYQSKDELTRRDSHQRFCVIHEGPAD